MLKIDGGWPHSQRMHVSMSFLQTSPTPQARSEPNPCILSMERGREPCRNLSTRNKKFHSQPKTYSLVSTEPPDVQRGRGHSSSPSSPSTRHPSSTPLLSFIMWLLTKQVGDEDEEHLLLHCLGPWLDPKSVLPLTREIYRLKSGVMAWTFMSHSNAMIEIRIRPMLKQLSLQISCEGERERRNPNETAMRAYHLATVG